MVSFFLWRALRPPIFFNGALLNGRRGKVLWYVYCPFPLTPVRQKSVFANCQKMNPKNELKK